MKTILITGSSGFIGEYLAKKFKEFYKVIGIDKNNDHQKNCHLFYKSDIRDFKKIKKCFEENKIDYIIHLAAEKSVLRCEENKDLAFKINFEASKFIYELSKKHGSKFIFMSSDQVFDGEKGDFFEDDPISPINYYGKLKADMEKVITYDLMKKSFLNSVICRTALDFGKIPTIQKKDFDLVKKKDFLVVQGFIVEQVIYRLQNNLKIILPDSEYINPTSVNLLYRQLKKVIENDVRGIVHCCGGEKVSRYEFGRKIAKLFGLDNKFISPENPIDPLRPKDVSMKHTDSERRLKMKFDTVDQMIEQIKNEILGG